MTPLRVLFLNENIGGHATVHRSIARVLEGHDDVAATFLDVPPPGTLARALGAPVPGLARLDLDGQPLRAQLARSATAARALRRALAATPVDVLHVYTQNAALLAVPTLRRIPTVVTLDTTNARNAYRLPYRRPTRWTPLTVAASKPLERRVFDAATTIVANSAWAVQSLVEDYGLHPDEVTVLPFGVSVPDLPEGAAPGTRARTPVLVFVGRQLDRKGGLRLLRLHQQHLRGVAELVLVTPEPVPAAEGVTVVDDLVPGDPRLWDVLRRASVFVFPSEIDQAPNSVLEAMAAGLPVVAHPSGAIPEMVVDGATGLVVPMGDDAALLAAIRRLVDDVDLRAAMGAAGRCRQQERYDMRGSVASLVAVLRGAAEDHRRRATAGAGA